MSLPRSLAFSFVLLLAICRCGAEISASHSPKEPKSADPVVITVTTTSTPVKADDLTLEYQVVEPGAYIALGDPGFATQWTSLPLSVTGITLKNGQKFTATIPGDVQKHRRLVRYRIHSRVDDKIVAPAPDDTQPNYAYFVYDGIPE